MNVFKWLFNPKYRYYSSVVKKVTRSIWDTEFKIEKSRKIREGVRQDRDRAVESVLNITNAIKTAPKEKVESLEKEKSEHEDRAKRFEGQMKMIDEQIEGVPASGENPGQQGLMDTLKALTELITMYQETLKRM